MKSIRTIILIIAMASLIALFLYMKENMKLKKELYAMTENFNVLGTDNSTLELSVTNLNKYLDRADTQHKVTVDSILKAHKIKIKNLKSYQHIKTEIIDVDTTLVAIEEVKPVNDSTYRLEFLDVRKCTKIGGYITSKDSASSLYITNIESKNNVYITKHFKKNFWDWLFCKQGIEIVTTTSDCGDTFMDEIIIE